MLSGISGAIWLVKRLFSEFTSKRIIAIKGGNSYWKKNFSPLKKNFGKSKK